MNRKMALVIIIASCLFTENAFSDEWKYYGGFTSAPGVDEILFYDSSSIIKSDTSIKLWVKSVVAGDIEKSLEDKSVIEKAATKIAKGYNAPISKIYPNATNAAYLEEAVNESTIKAKSSILYQIECSDNTFRKITGASFNKDGTTDLRFGISEWEDIPLESNAENLAKILCGPK